MRGRCCIPPCPSCPPNCRTSTRLREVADRPVPTFTKSERMTNLLESPVPTAGRQNVPDPTRPKFPADGGFQAEVRRRVNDYFRATGKSERDNPWMYLKTATICAWLVGSWALLVFVVQAWWQAVPAAISLALALAAMGFSIQHDGGHHAYSRRRW